MKKIFILSIVILILLVSLTGCDEENKKLDTPNENNLTDKSDEIPVIIGRFVRNLDGFYYVVVTDEPENLLQSVISMNTVIGKDNQITNEEIFENLQNWDKIKVTHGEIRDSDPPNMEVISIEFIEKGSSKDIPEDIYNYMIEFGWVNEQ